MHSDAEGFLASFATDWFNERYPFKGSYSIWPAAPAQWPSTNGHAILKTWVRIHMLESDHAGATLDRMAKMVAELLSSLSTKYASVSTVQLVPCLTAFMQQWNLLK
jgi:hypothetical protein